MRNLQKNQRSNNRWWSYAVLMINYENMFFDAYDVMVY